MGTCAVRLFDQLQADAGFVGRARARRQHDALGLQGQRLIGGQGVIALHPDLRAQFSQEMEEIVGEAVIIIDQEKHAGRKMLSFGRNPGPPGRGGYIAPRYSAPNI